MKTTKRLATNFLIPLLTVLAIGCSSDSDEVVDPPINPPLGSTLTEVVASGDAFENFPPNITETEVGGTETTRDADFDRKDSTNLDNTIEQRWICTEKEVDITGGSDTFPLYNPNASVIWPGNLLQGKTLGNATPRDIVVKRAAGTITYDLVNGNEIATRSVDVIDQGSVQQAMNDIIAGSGDAPARFTLDVEAINSREQLAIEMGLSVSNFTTKVSSDFSYNSDSNVSSVLVKLTQQYYTMSYVKPTSLDEVFDPSVTPEQLATFIQPDNPATFISSVTYGRIFYMLYESSASAQDMEAALRGSYNAVAGKASAEVNINSLREYNNLNVKVIAYGGDSEGTLEAVGAVFAGDEAVNNLKDIIDRLALAGNIETGLPLSYVVNSLEDPSQVVSTNLATRYTVKNCELKGIKPPLLFADLDGLFEDGIGAMVNVKDSDVLIFNKAGTNYAWFNGNLSSILGDPSPKIYDLDDPNAPLGDVRLEDIGAGMVSQDLPSGRQIYIYSTDGRFAQILNLDNSKIPENALPNEMIGTFAASGNILPVNQLYGDAGNFIIGTDGFEAAVRVGATRQVFFGKPGNRYQVYDGAVGSNGSFEDPEDTDSWFGDPQSIEKNGALFERVNAATRFTLSGNSRRYLFVNEEGTEIMEWFSSTESGQDKFNGPWVITKD